MIDPNRFTLDTNILIYAVDRSAGAKHDAADRLVQDAADKDCCLMLQSLGEFFHAATRKGLARIEDIAQYTAVWQRVFTIVPASVDSHNEAVNLVAAHRFSFWDAMILATAKEAGCACILSEDIQDGRRVDGGEIVNPFASGSAAILGKLLR